MDLTVGSDLLLFKASNFKTVERTVKFNFRYRKSRKKGFLSLLILHPQLNMLCLMQVLGPPSWAALHHHVTVLSDGQGLHQRRHFDKANIIFYNFIFKLTQFFRGLTADPIMSRHSCQLAVKLCTESLLKGGFGFYFSEEKTGFDYRPPSTKDMPVLLSCRILISTSIRPFILWQAFSSS